MIKKILLIILTVLSLVVISTAGQALAISVTPLCSDGRANSTDVCADINSQNGSDPIISILKTIIKVISWALGIVAVIVIIVAGLKFITSGGDPQGVSRARDAIIYAAVGILVAVLAQALVLFVLDNIS